jgi:hypothetical protein
VHRIPATHRLRLRPRRMRRLANVLSAIDRQREKFRVETISTCRVIIMRL